MITTTERNAATLREIREAYTADEWFELLADCVTRHEQIARRDRARLFQELIEDNMLNSDDVEWLKTQTGIEA